MRIGAAEVACLIGLDTEITVVPPRVAGLDPEGHVRPGEIEVDDLTAGQRYGVLTLRFG